MKRAILNSFIGLIVLSGCSVFLAKEPVGTSGASGGRLNVREQLAEQQTMIDSLQKEVQVLRGRVQETENLLAQKTKKLQEENSKTQSQFSRLDSETRSNKERIAHLENYLNVETTNKSSILDGFEDSNDKEPTESEAYESAKQRFERGDHQGARNAFKYFIKKYPKSEQADNAIFWIGETYFHEKWYEKAILEYEKVIAQYPKGNKVPAALLKQGISFYLHGVAEKDDKFKQTAIGIMKELIDKYPKSNEAKIAAKKLKEYTQ